MTLYEGTKLHASHILKTFTGRLLVDSARRKDRAENCLHDYVTVNKSNVSFETVVRQRVTGCARSSVIDEGLEDTIVRPHPKQEVAVQEDSSRTSSAA